MSQNTIISDDRAESLDVAVGRRVHMLMWEKRVTQTALGRSIGLDQSGLGKRLRGERGWSLDDLRDVADELGTTIAYLVGETEEAPTPKGGGHTLPDLDSNQEPAGFKPGELIRVDFGSVA